MVVTKNTLEYPETSDFGHQYRVIYEALNYVLLVARVEPIRSQYPTEFMIFSLQSLGQPVTKETELRQHSCSRGTWGTAEAFDWPVEKLLETFKKSLCLSAIEFDGDVSFGWGNGPHIRVDD